MERSLSTNNPREIRGCEATDGHERSVKSVTHDASHEVAHDIRQLRVKALPELVRMADKLKSIA
jgi:hypothetical protein